MASNRNPAQWIRSLNELPDAARGAVVSIGNFDGVHRGHRVLLRRLTTMAREMNRPSLVFTFDPPPLRLLRPEQCPPSLTWMERRADLLGELGVDFLLAYPTSRDLLALTATEFFDELLVHQLGVSGLVEGPNFRFGKQRGGDVALLESLCDTHGIALSIVAPEMEGTEWVSSSMIRDWVSQGSIEQANRALVSPYRVMGHVAHGAARGRTLGFPTANLVDIPILLPAHGVYAGRIVGTGSRDSMASGFPAAVNIGPNPTFGENATKVEVHILDFSGDLYGADLELEILARIRDVQKFSGKDALLEQLQMDVIATRHICSPS